jgi:hypothetical protein
MTINDYLTQYPNERVWPSYPDAPGTIAEGMLQFDETAAHFAGPFDGNYVYFRLADMRTLPGWGPLCTVAELQQRQRFSRHNLPWRLRTNYGQDAQSEEHLQKRLALLTPKELKAWQEGLDKWRIDMPTLEKPFALKLAGNDDVSYTKYYPTLEAAQAELSLYTADQPLNFPLHVQENGFVFTN